MICEVACGTEFVRISLAITPYQVGKLILFGLDENDQRWSYNRNIARCPDLDGRSISPSTPSALNRATHLRKARGLIPPSREARSGLSPLNTSRTNRSRPRGVCLAFLWTFI